MIFQIRHGLQPSLRSIVSYLFFGTQFVERSLPVHKALMVTRPLMSGVDLCPAARNASCESSHGTCAGAGAIVARAPMNYLWAHCCVFTLRWCCKYYLFIIQRSLCTSSIIQLSTLVYWSLQCHG